MNYLLLFLCLQFILTNASNLSKNIKRIGLYDALIHDLEVVYGLNLMDIARLSIANKYFYQIFAKQRLVIPDEVCKILATNMKCRGSTYIINMTSIDLDLYAIVKCSRMLYPSNKDKKHWKLEPERKLVSMHIAVHNNDLAKVNEFIDKYDPNNVDIQPAMLEESLKYSGGNLGFTPEKAFPPKDYSIDVNHFIAATICCAASVGHIDMVRMLLEKKFDVRDWWIDFHTESYLDTALRYAARNEHFEVVEMLFNKGAKVGRYMFNALYHAATYGHLEMIKLLFEKSYSDCLANVDGAFQRPSCYCYGHCEVLEILFDKSNNAVSQASVECVFARAALRGCHEVLELLFEKREISEYVISKAFEVAATNGHLSVVKILFDKTSIENHRQGLYFARRCMQDDVVEWLDEQGVELSDD